MPHILTPLDCVIGKVAKDILPDFSLTHYNHMKTTVKQKVKLPVNLMLFITVSISTVLLTIKS